MTASTFKQWVAGALIALAVVWLTEVDAARTICGIAAVYFAMCLLVVSYDDWKNDNRKES